MGNRGTSGSVLRACHSSEIIDVKRTRIEREIWYLHSYLKDGRHPDHSPAVRVNLPSNLMPTHPTAHYERQESDQQTLQLEHIVEHRHGHPIPV